MQDRILSHNGTNRRPVNQCYFIYRLSLRVDVEGIKLFSKSNGHHKCTSLKGSLFDVTFVKETAAVHFRNCV